MRGLLDSSTGHLPRRSDGYNVERTKYNAGNAFYVLRSTFYLLAFAVGRQEGTS